MRTAVSVLLLVAAVARAEPDKAVLRALDRAEQALGKATLALEKAAGEKREARRLRAYKRIKHLYRTALEQAGRGAPRADDALRPSFDLIRAKATRALVDVLNDETRIYWKRGAVTSARRANAEAAKLAPKDKQVLDLAKEIGRIKGDEPGDDKEYEPGFTARRAARDAAHGLDHRQRQHRRR